MLGWLVSRRNQQQESARVLPRTRTEPRPPSRPVIRQNTTNSRQMTLNLDLPANLFLDLVLDNLFLVEALERDNVVRFGLCPGHVDATKLALAERAANLERRERERDGRAVTAGARARACVRERERVRRRVRRASARCAPNKNRRRGRMSRSGCSPSSLSAGIEREQSRRFTADLNRRALPLRRSISLEPAVVPANVVDSRRRRRGIGRRRALSATGCRSRSVGGGSGNARSLCRRSRALVLALESTRTGCSGGRRSPQFRLRLMCLNRDRRR